MWSAIEIATRLTACPGDGPREQWEKAVAVILSTIVGFASSFFWVINLVAVANTDSGISPVTITFPLQILSCAALLLWVVCRKSLRLEVLEAWIVMATITSISIDWTVRITLGIDGWPLVLACSHIILLVESHDSIRRLIFFSGLVWIILRSLEDAYAFMGLFTSFDNVVRHCHDNPAIPITPLCPMANLPVIISVRLLAYVVDYYLTSYFANGLRKEHAKVVESLTLAQDVMVALVEFNLENARLMVEDSEGDIKVVFLELLANLQLYRPYLPDSLFDNSGSPPPSPMLRADTDPLEVAAFDKMDTTSFLSDDKEGEDRVVKAQDQRNKLKQQLGLSVRDRKGSVLLLSVRHTKHQIQFDAVIPFVQSALTHVRAHHGKVVRLGADDLLSTWNTHRPSARYCVAAASCALDLETVVTNIEWKAAIVTGILSFGYIGSDTQKAPFVSGAVTHQAAALTKLCSILGAKLVVTDKVHEHIHSTMGLLPIDVVPEIGADSSEGCDVIYELYANAPTERALLSYTKAFSLFRQRQYAEAIAELTDFMHNSDLEHSHQGYRLARFCCAGQQGILNFPCPYHRRFRSWEEFEEEVKDVAIPTEISPPMSMSLKSPNASSTWRSTEDREDNTLRSEIEQACLHTTHTLSSGDLPETIKDRFGHQWRRSLKRLGHGAFGEVWMGMSEEGSLVAMKSMKLPSSTTTTKKREANVEKMLQEVTLLSTLQHENVVGYLGSAVVGSYTVIIMEYVSGGSLASVLSQFGTIPTPSVRRYSKDMLRGLAFLHHHGVMHRDFKPGNVLLGVDGGCKLADFGAAVELKAKASHKVVGTPMYMAPEACRGNACPASDVWGVGITVVQLLTGSVPYQLPAGRQFNASEFIKLIATQEITPRIPTELLTSHNAVEFVQSALLVDPSARPGAEELLLSPFLTM